MKEVITVEVFHKDILLRLDDETKELFHFETATYCQNTATSLMELERSTHYHIPYTDAVQIINLNKAIEEAALILDRDGYLTLMKFRKIMEKYNMPDSSTAKMITVNDVLNALTPVDYSFNEVGWKS